jgi:aminoglycoside phosphotransferase family enzyme/predicted kinase
VTGSSCRGERLSFSICSAASPVDGIVPGQRNQPTNPAPLSPLAAGLSRAAAYDHPVEKVRVAETHISWVFLTGEYAYKVKKPVKLPFLDFSTLERRRYFCEEELRLNRRLAPELYLDVVPVGGDPAEPRVNARPAIEYAVKMRQFPDAARLDRRLESGTLPDGALRSFAARLARFHAEQRPVVPRDPARAAATAALENFDELEQYLEPRTLAPLRDWTREHAAALGSAFARRAALGRYRECHGDLHLENLLVLDDRIVAFDALEFDPQLREIDVLSEAAFLAMDLGAHGREDLAYVFSSEYLEAGGDYDGMDVLRFYLVYRALVRAKVRAIKAAQRSAESGRTALEPYLAAAASLVAPRKPLLVITHGLSGSGKTHVTQGLIGPLRALRVRSDLERKRLHGLAAAARSGSGVGQGLYGPRENQRTYARLAEIAQAALRSGFDAIVDAAFLRRQERSAFERLAKEADARFTILDCTAEESVLRSRVAAREAAGRDASEAGIAVLERQLTSHEALDASEKSRAVVVDTERGCDYTRLAANLASR